MVVENLPQAYKVRVMECAGAECGRPHVVLLDESGQPFAQFVVSELWAERHIEQILDILKRNGKL